MTLTREQVIEESRPAFEEYFLASRKSKGANRKPTFHRHEQDGTYTDDHTQRHWWTWQQSVVASFNAGRARGLGEAVEVCRQQDEEGEGPDCWDWHAKDYAAAIEQLKEKT